MCCTRGLRAAFWCCLGRHQKSGASTDGRIKRLLLVCRIFDGGCIVCKRKKKKNSMLYSRFASSVLVLPRATPEKRSECSRKDKMVAARVPHFRYAFGDR
ncbi:hypothetical protein NDU88_004543 [Pleurodeles waltl]|uniref:Secreted protein n=1 Tax=Pleurodeles waltl TaxID=8319 RepID=A0AAV7T831_PLEWA|nr:hypothetical protein NDU88_004543 [Pleurodeles waltl]